MTVGLPDSDLVVRARDGDRDAFAALYEQYGGMVHGILTARVAVHEVDDLLQDVFVRAFQKLPRLREVDAFGGWLATIARNLANDRHRKHVPTVELVAEPSVRPAPTAEAREVLRVLQSLPDPYRETLTLRLVEGLTGPEIAEVTGLTKGSVRVNLHRGMKLFRERLREGGWE